MLCQDCGTKPAQEGYTTCFRCRVVGVGFSFRGGAVIGRGGWNTTKSEWLAEHVGSGSEKELAKNPNIERAS